MLNRDGVQGRIGKGVFHNKEEDSSLSREILKRTSCLLLKLLFFRTVITQLVISYLKTRKRTNNLSHSWQYTPYSLELTFHVYLVLWTHVNSQFIHSMTIRHAFANLNIIVSRVDCGFVLRSNMLPTEQQGTMKELYMQQTYSATLFLVDLLGQINFNNECVDQSIQVILLWILEFTALMWMCWKHSKLVTENG